MTTAAIATQVGQSWLTVVVACGGIGALVDFCLGKAGQKHVRETLETWWIKVAYAKLNTFGREEAGGAAVVLTAAFGTLFSLRRFFAVAIIWIFGALTWYQLPKLFDKASISEVFVFGLDALVQSVGFTLSMSFTIYICKIAEKRLASKSLLNIPAFAAVTVFQLVLVGFIIGKTSAFTLAISENLLTLAELISQNSGHFTLEQALHLLELSLVYGGTNVYPGVEVISGLHGYFMFQSDVLRFGPAYLRIILALIFLLSCSMKPLSQLLLGLLMRLIESDKPVFTFVCGATAAVAKGFHDVLIRG